MKVLISGASNYMKFSKRASVLRSLIRRGTIKRPGDAAFARREAWRDDRSHNSKGVRQ